MRSVIFEISLNGMKCAVAGIASYNEKTGQVILPKEAEEFIERNWNNTVTGAAIKFDDKKIMLATQKDGWFTTEETIH